MLPLDSNMLAAAAAMQNSSAIDACCPMLSLNKDVLAAATGALIGQDSESSQRCLNGHMHACIMTPFIAGVRAQVLEECRRLMRQGQAARVVADLAPMLLDEGYTHAEALRRERRTFLDALHLLLVHALCLLFLSCLSLSRVWLSHLSSVLHSQSIADWC